MKWNRDHLQLFALCLSSSSSSSLTILILFFLCAEWLGSPVRTNHPASGDASSLGRPFFNVPSASDTASRPCDKPSSSSLPPPPLLPFIVPKAEEDFVYRNSGIPKSIASFSRN